MIWRWRDDLEREEMVWRKKEDTFFNHSLLNNRGQKGAGMRLDVFYILPLKGTARGKSELSFRWFSVTLTNFRKNKYN